MQPKEQPSREKIPARTLQEIFCERLNCPKDEFEKRLFWMCVRPNVIFLARLFWIFYRRIFYGDLEMLRQLGQTTNTRELRYEIESFRRYHPPRGFIRGDLKVRVSGRRLLKIGSKLFGIEASRKARSLRITTMPSEVSSTQPSNPAPESKGEETASKTSQQPPISQPNSG